MSIRRLGPQNFDTLPRWIGPRFVAALVNDNGQPVGIRVRLRDTVNGDDYEHVVKIGDYLVRGVGTLRCTSERPL